MKSNQPSYRLRSWVFALCLSLPTAGIAGGQKGEWLADKLELNDSQRTEFLAVMESAHAERKTLRDDGDTLTKEERHDRMKAIHQNMRANLDAVLTEDQRSRLDEIHKSRHKNKHGKKHRIGKLVKELNLNSDQKAEFKVLMRQTREARKSTRETWKDLSPEQRQAAKQSHRLRFESQLNAILDLDQQARFKQLKEERAERWNQHRGRNKKG